jgi:hypothetical protein
MDTEAEEFDPHVHAHGGQDGHLGDEQHRRDTLIVADTPGPTVALTAPHEAFTLMSAACLNAECTLQESKNLST